MLTRSSVNKEPIIKALIDKTMPYEFRHIRKLSNLISISDDCFDADVKSVCCKVSKAIVSESKRFHAYDCGCIIS